MPASVKGERRIRGLGFYGGKAMGSTERKIPFSCPVCGRKTERETEGLKEGAVLTCPFCKLSLRLHGHMLEEVEKEILKLKNKDKV